MLEAAIQCRRLSTVADLLGFLDLALILANRPAGSPQVNQCHRAGIGEVVMNRAGNKRALLLHLIRPGLVGRKNEAFGKEVNNGLQARDLVGALDEAGPGINQFDAEVEQAKDAGKLLMNGNAGSLVFNEKPIDLIFLAVGSDPGDQLVKPMPVRPAIEEHDLGIAALIPEDAR